LTGNQTSDTRAARLSNGRLKLDGPAFRKGVPLAIAGVWLCSLVLYAGTRVAPSDAGPAVTATPAPIARHAVMPVPAAPAIVPAIAALMDNPPLQGIPLAWIRPAVAHTPPQVLPKRPFTAASPPRPERVATHKRGKPKARAAATATPRFARAAYRAPRPVATVGPAHTARVWVTGYDLVGTTATGGQSGPGVCAVDPYFIPFGTRITIAGVGTCTALDTGPAVAGAHIDVWVPDYQTAINLTGWYTASW